jgi:hypothetical protein
VSLEENKKWSEAKKEKAKKTKDQSNQDSRKAAFAYATELAFRISLASKVEDCVRRYAMFEDAMKTATRFIQIRQANGDKLDKEVMDFLEYLKTTQKKFGRELYW